MAGLDPHLFLSPPKVEQASVAIGTNMPGQEIDTKRVEKLKAIWHRELLVGSESSSVSMLVLPTIFSHLYVLGDGI